MSSTTKTPKHVVPAYNLPRGRAVGRGKVAEAARVAEVAEAAEAEISVAEMAVAGAGWMATKMRLALSPWSIGVLGEGQKSKSAGCQT
jgi:hypothetical protein